VGKHFPGLGAVADDPHKKLPSLDASIELLRRRELVPFAAAFRGGLGAIMTAHVALPRVTGGADTPATLSPRIMKGLLREEMHFDGVAITDALQMDALARKRGPGALALDAVLAGSDMVLALGTEQERRAVLDDLLAAYRDGRLPKRRVDEALRRILTTKERLRAMPPSVPQAMLVSDIAARAITLVPGSAPLPEWSPDGVLYVGPPGPLQTLLAPTRSLTLPDRMSHADVDIQFMKVRAVAASARICVVAARNPDEFAIVTRLRSELPELRILFVNLGSPWRVLIGPHSSTLLTYAEDDPSQIAAARVLLGQARATGTAPVSLRTK
jgi:beta-N-acetylhexosaminidase